MPEDSVPLRPLALALIIALTRQGSLSGIGCVSPCQGRGALNSRGVVPPPSDRQFAERAPVTVVKGGQGCVSPSGRMCQSFTAVKMPKRGGEFGDREEPGWGCHRLTFPLGLAFLNTLGRERVGRSG